MNKPTLKFSGFYTQALGNELLERMGWPGLNFMVGYKERKILWELLSMPQRMHTGCYGQDFSHYPEKMSFTGPIAVRIVKAFLESNNPEAHEFARRICFIYDIELLPRTEQDTEDRGTCILLRYWIAQHDAKARRAGCEACASH